MGSLTNEHSLERYTISLMFNNENGTGSSKKSNLNAYRPLSAAWGSLQVLVGGKAASWTVSSRT